MDPAPHRASGLSTKVLCVLTFAGAGVGGPPVDIRLAALRSMRRLLPRMHLAGYSSSIMHPLIRCLP